MLRVTHGMLLLGVAKHTLYCLFSAGINPLAAPRLPKLLCQIQMLLPNVTGQDFLPFIIELIYYLCQIFFYKYLNRVFS